MKHILTLVLSISLSSVGFCQEIIYDTTHQGTNAFTTEINSAANGPNAHIGDEVVVVGTARLVTSVAVDMFVTAGTENLPYDLTLTLHRACPEGVCGAGGATYINGSEQTQTITAGSTAKHTVTFTYDGLNVASIQDDTFSVVLTSSRSGVQWVRNEVATVGMQPTLEPPAGAFIRCGASDPANNGCAFIYAAGGGIHAMTVTATEALNTIDLSLNDGITVFPNPIKDMAYFNFDSSITVERVSVYNIAGQLILENNSLSSETLKIDMSSITRGTYFMTFDTPKGRVVKQLIKR